jgi:hypothetical protein
MAAFSRYIGIDYSGAEVPESSLKGLRVYGVLGESAATEVAPPPSPRRYWTRRGIAHWLAERLAEDVPTIVGIDHGFSFPLRYFEVQRLPPVRDGLAGNGAARTGNTRWRRMTEQTTRRLGQVSVVSQRMVAYYEAPNAHPGALGPDRAQLGQLRNQRLLAVLHRFALRGFQRLDLLLDQGQPRALALKLGTQLWGYLRAVGLPPARRWATSVI